MEITSTDSFLRYYRNVQKRTDVIVKEIPAEHIEWTYRDGKFTIGDLLRHIAGINRYMFAENACLRPQHYPGHGRELAEGYDTVMEYFNRLQAETCEVIATISDAGMNEKCVTPAGAEMTVWKWLRAMVEHEIHHRGQIYLYLGMCGQDLPRLYGMSSEEVRDAAPRVGE